MILSTISIPRLNLRTCSFCISTEDANIRNQELITASDAEVPPATTGPVAKVALFALLGLHPSAIYMLRAPLLAALSQIAVVPPVQSFSMVVRKVVETTRTLCCGDVGSGKD
jgi:hypothetical protein